MKKINLFLVLILMLVLCGCGHKHEYQEEVVAPTCTERGYTEHVCSCGNSYKDSYTNALGHSYGEWIVVKEATEEETAEEKEKVNVVAIEPSSTSQPADCITEESITGRIVRSTLPSLLRDSSSDLILFNPSRYANGAYR